MALIACKDCKKEFSTDAKRCPQCGAKKSNNKIRKPWPWKKIGYGLLLYFIAMQLLHSSMNTSVPTKELAKASSEHNELQGAKLACEELVKNSLHDADSAEFDDINQFSAKKETDGSYFVQVSLRARNGFNAVRHFHVDCKMLNKNGQLVPVLKEIN